MGASLLGYTKLYGQVPGGQAEFLRGARVTLTDVKPDIPEAGDLRGGLAAGLHRRCRQR